jgi:hypothetical protein
MIFTLTDYHDAEKMIISYENSYHAVAAFRHRVPKKRA